MTLERSNWIFLCVIFLSLWACKVNIPTELPAYTDYKMPMPGLAAPGEPFTPVMAGPAKDNTPLSGEWTRTAGPDESVILSGEALTAYRRANEGKDSRFKVYSSGGSITDANVLRAESDKAVITINKNIQKWGMYLVWPGNKAGYGKPIAINKTEAWWIGPAEVSRGSRVSVYGRNLSQYNDTISSFIYLKSSQGYGLWAKIVKVNPYKVDFMIPPNMPEGDYEVWAHNGHGGKYGWSAPLKLKIAREYQWSDKVFNVKNYGASGNGVSDDTKAIHRALAEAKNTPGSTVYFPEGTYLISGMLSISDNSRWRGVQKDRSIIKCGPNFFTRNAVVSGRATNFQISNLTFDANNNIKGEGPEFREEAINLDVSSKVKLDNLKILCKGYSALRLDHANNVEITNTTVIARKSFLGSCSNLIIDKCDFYLTNDAEMALHSWDGVNISVTNSTCRDLDNRDVNNGQGWGKGRFFHSAGNGGSTRHTYLENNRTLDLAVRPVGTDQNSGEQFLWEGFSAKWYGKVVSSKPSSTTLHKFSKALVPFKTTAVITKGRGVGQSRLISAVKDGIILLDRPWNLPPDKSSTIAIGHFADRIVMYKNYIDGKAESVHSENITASTGIQPYGGVLNFIADGNIITEVRSGLANWSTQHSIGIDPNYFNLYVNNKITLSRWGIVNALLEVKRPEMGLMGTTYRRNVINTALEAGIKVWLSPSAKPIMDNFLYEHNSFINVPKGFLKSNGANLSTQTLYKNQFRSMRGSAAVDLSPGIKLFSNSYTGFASAYSGTPRQLVVAPLRVIEIYGVSKGSVSSVPFVLWNTGTSRSRVRINTNAPWLKVSDANPLIETEKTGVVTLEADPEKLPADTHTTSVSVISGKEEKKYTVIFNVAESAEKMINKQAGNDF
ncbi:glycoside hydrolase family 55 protein [Paradesertivirga mongoliensis]|uniref:Glycoside hydrolase family 55 protein n=1 Tax=Paradesertivirga mongoliensis TaxID=2100740 RepID=A0ABW4ZNU3_9SPHI|nr:glycoside hydrolase family 55 protein [Pedobacter mongoliensis]